ncbi:hypothetical protein IGI42_002956 [Enterococcus sp. AZ109]
MLIFVKLTENRNVSYLSNRFFGEIVQTMSLNLSAHVKKITLDKL